MNRKERRLALRTVLNERAARLIVVEDIAGQLLQPKTKELAAALVRWGVETGERVLLVLAEIPQPVYLSARNISNVKLIRADSLNIYDLLLADKIVATAAALEKIGEVYGG
jgi:large subunit ribosomal protein L4